MKDIITTIKDRILSILKQRGMSIYELANQADISEACIRNWYSKRNYTPSLVSLINICSVLEISLSQLTLKEDENYFPVDKNSKQMLEAWHAMEPQARGNLMSIIQFINKGKSNDGLTFIS